MDSVQAVSEVQNVQQRRLKDDKQLQKERKEQYASLFEQQGINKKTAGKYADAMVKNDIAEERVANRIVCYSKEEAEQLKKSGQYNPDDISYLSKKERAVVDKNSGDFFTNGKFDSEKYKQKFVNWSGEDYCLNDGSKLERPEDHTAAGYFSTTDGRARSMAKKGGLDTTNLFWKRAAHVLGFTAIGGATTGLFNKLSKSKVNFSDEAHITINGRTAVDDIMPNEHVTVGSSVPGAAVVGGTLGALAGLATINAVGGEKDLFNGREPKAIIESGNVKGLDKKIAPFMQAIIDNKDLTNDQKTELVTKAIGKESSSLANRREIAAMFNSYIAEAKAAKENGGAQQPATQPADQNGQQPATQPAAGTGTQPVQGNQDDTQEACPLEDYDGVKTSKQAVKSFEYKPKKGEYWYGIVAAKYGLKDPVEIRQCVKALKKQHGLSDEQIKQNIQPRVMNLPEDLMGHKLNNDAKVNERTQKFVKAGKYNGKFSPEERDVSNPIYGLRDCKGTIGEYESVEKRNEARQHILEERNKK